jgi:hypothetical protein
MCPVFGLPSVISFSARIDMSTATLTKMVRDPRTGQIHLPNETVAILAVMKNLDRTLLKVRWRAGGDCMVFPDDLD